MPRRATPLLLVATGLCGLVLAIAVAPPWRRDDAPLPRHFVDSELVRGLSSTTPDDPAAQRAQQWLRGQPLATQLTVQQAKPEALEKLLARPNPFQLPGCIGLAKVESGRCDVFSPALDFDSLVPAAPALGGQLAGLRQPGN